MKAEDVAGLGVLSQQSNGRCWQMGHQSSWWSQLQSDAESCVCVCVCVCVYSVWCVLVTRSCPTLCNPMNCSSPDSSVHGILQVRILEWVAIPLSKGSSRTKDWTQVSHIADRFFTISEPPGRPQMQRRLSPILHGDNSKMRCKGNSKSNMKSSFSKKNKSLNKLQSPKTRGQYPMWRAIPQWRCFLRDGSAPGASDSSLKTSLHMSWVSSTQRGLWGKESSSVLNFSVFNVRSRAIQPWVYSYQWSPLSTSTCSTSWKVKGQRAAPFWRLLKNSKIGVNWMERKRKKLCVEWGGEKFISRGSRIEWQDFQKRMKPA